jgi:hypothetical protein
MVRPPNRYAVAKSDVMVQVWSSRAAGASPLGVSSRQAGTAGTTVGVRVETDDGSAADGGAALDEGVTLGDAQPASSRAAASTDRLDRRVIPLTVAQRL